jgi:tungstate transport system substrate-binding protein
VVDHDARLFNQYSAILGNSAQHPQVKADMGMAFIEWLTSRGGSRHNASYRVEGEQVFFANYAEP